MKKTFFTILFFALSFTLSFGQSGGTGTSGDPYQISTYADLQWLQTATTEWVAGKYFLQTADIDAAATSGDGWNPIGNSTFDGTYDGGGFAIDNLTITGAGELGFIQQTSSTTTIKNLGLTNVALTVGDNSYSGALVAFVNGGGTIENCYSTGSIVSNSSRLYYNLGGLIGRIKGGSASDSYSEVNISYVGIAQDNIGGFVGYNNGSITNCYATGTIQGGSSVGGFVGTNDTGGDITKSYSTGNVTASSSSSGGFVGYNYKGTISECYSTGDVSGTARVGGFIGLNRKAVAVVSNCYSFGEVTGNVGDHVGGFCGRNYQDAKLEKCYSTGASNDKGFVGASYSGTAIVADCFFDTETSGATDSYATGETTTNMKIQATFTNWDFGTVWEIVGANYPRLQNQPDSALPVELTSFTATASNDAVVLNWETATEVNNYGFEVESKRASTDNWSKIGFVDGHGNSNSPNSYSFIATDGAKYYRLKQVDTDGAFEYSEVVEVEGSLSYKLSQNYPNPFNPSTTISFTMPEVAKASITIYNALGQKVMEVVNKEFSAGTHSVNIDASQLSSGMYFYKLQTNSFSKTMKMLLIK